MTATDPADCWVLHGDWNVPASVPNGSGGSVAGTAQGSYICVATQLHGLASAGRHSTGYGAAYNAAGNMTCRAVGAATCSGGTPSGESLAYDALGRLLSWQSAPGAAATSTGAYAYAYDGAGERVWQQDVKTTATSTTTTTMTYVLGGLQQVTTTAVTGQSPSTSTRSYYTLPGGVLASRKDNDNLIEQATDPLGTPLAALNAKTGLVGEQLRAPYGQPRYNAEASTNGGMHTALGFTGQWEDTQAPGSSGLDYFHARYYDPSVGRFLSADPARPGLGDPAAMDGYGYVGGRVENATDPSGLTRAPDPASATGSWSQGEDTAFLLSLGYSNYTVPGTGGLPYLVWLRAYDPQLYGQLSDYAASTGGSSAAVAALTQREGTDWWASKGAQYLNDNYMEALRVEGTVVLQADLAASGHNGDYKGGSAGDLLGGELELSFGGADDAALLSKLDNTVADDTHLSEPGGADGGMCSFSADTPVATPSGEQAIGTLRVGDTVEAYNPTTGKAEPEQVQHVWLNHDHDLVDMHITAGTGKAATTSMTSTVRASGHGLLVVGDDAAAAVHLSPSLASHTSGETIHTTANHPWLTADRGWVPAGNLTPGERLVTLSGGTGVVAWVHPVPGAADRYNLTVQHDHTYAVGTGQWVVHNDGCGGTVTVTDRDLYRRGNASSPRIDNVRPGKDIPEGTDTARNTDTVTIQNEDGTVQTRVMGQSTFDNLAPGRNVWKLPAGTNLADVGLRALNDEDAHWAIQPLDTMSKVDYEAGLQLLNEMFVKTW